MSEPNFGVDAAYNIPEELWYEIEPNLPPLPAKKKAGRPRMDDRQAMTAIFYLLRTGCQWKALPRSLGASSTVHDRFQDGGKKVYSDVCGSMDCLYMMKIIQ